MEVLENGKPDLVIEGQGLDLELTRRDPSAAKGQPSLTLGWESTPHTALGVCGQSLGKGSVMEVRSKHLRAAVATPMACQLPGARKLHPAAAMSPAPPRT